MRAGRVAAVLAAGALLLTGGGAASGERPAGHDPATGAPSVAARMVDVLEKNSPPQPQEAPPADAGAKGGTVKSEGPQGQPGNVYIIRDYAEPTLWPVSFLVDNRMAVSLGQKSYTVLHLAPGPHAFQVRWPALAGQIGKTFDFNVVEGRTYYFRMIGDYDFQGRYYTETGGAERLRPGEGEALIKTCCKFKPPRTGF